MLSYSRSHLADHVLLRTLTNVSKQDCITTAELLALVAEVDKRGLFRGEGYPSMFRYCVEKLHMSEDVAYKRIQTARAARRFPAIFSGIMAGRLHLTAVVLLKPYLTAKNADDLLRAAAGKTKAKVELLIAERFPRADVPTTLAPLDVTRTGAGVAAAWSDALASTTAPEQMAQVLAGKNAELVPEPVAPAISVPIAVPMVPLSSQRRVAPLSPGRFELRLTISQELHDKLKRAQELLSHAIPSGDIAEVLERALDELIAKQEKIQLAKTDKPGRPRRSSNPRHIPASVKRAVQMRDGGQCTYTNSSGHRCGARKFLQYDHVIPVARGGASTADNIRLRCRAHNQLEAERVFGAGFMEQKRTRISREQAVVTSTGRRAENACQLRFVHEAASD